MKRKKIGLNIFLAIIGVVLFCIGGIGIKMEWFADFRALAGILIGAGCGIFGHNLGTVVQTKIMEKNPTEAHKIEIEQNDERNILIGNTAKSNAFDAMGYIYATIILIFVLLNVDYIVIMLLVGAYLLVHGIMIFHLSKLTKEM